MRCAHHTRHDACLQMSHFLYAPRTPAAAAQVEVMHKEEVMRLLNQQIRCAPLHGRRGPRAGPYAGIRCGALAPVLPAFDSRAEQSALGLWPLLA
jgi:hypothetical protein